MKKAIAKSTTVKIPVMGKITEASTKTVENGYIVTLSDKNFNSKQFVAKDLEEAMKLMQKAKK